MEQSTPLPTLEPLSDYRLGGYHPVHIGDTLNDGQYIIADKLGWGSASTAWLATDVKHNNICVAVSITRSEDEERYRTGLMSMIRALKGGNDDHPGKKNLLFPSNSFTLSGPNGLHFCLITPFQGQTVSKLTKRNQGAETRPLALVSAKRAIWDLAHGIHFIHTVQITHNDLHPANLFLGMPDDQPWRLEKFLETCGHPQIIDIEHTVHSTQDNHFSRYLVVDSMQGPFDQSLFPGPLKIADFGEAFQSTNLNPKMSSIGPYLVPELNSPDDCSTAADVWMFGCATYQLLSGFDLFGTVNDSSIKIIREMVTVLGLPPQRILDSWSDLFGESQITSMSGPTCDLATRVRDIRYGNETRGMRRRVDEMSETDVISITKLLIFVLQYDPIGRPTMEQVLHYMENIFRQGKDSG